MNKHYPRIVCYCVLIVCLLSSCGAEDVEQQKKNTSTTKIAANDKIPKAENGITVVSPNGWETKEMEFQQRYCEDMMANVNTVNSTLFCSCFLEKIQYYYKPIYAREAFTDQKKWNEACFESARNN